MSSSSSNVFSSCRWPQIHSDLKLELTSIYIKYLLILNILTSSVDLTGEPIVYEYIYSKLQLEQPNIHIYIYSYVLLSNAFSSSVGLTGELIPTNVCSSVPKGDALTTTPLVNDEKTYNFHDWII